MIRRSSFEFITGRARGTERKGDFYRQGTAGSWRRELDESLLGLVSARVGRLLVELGYEDSSDWRDWRLRE
jgi:hypothetical protein